MLITIKKCCHLPVFIKGLRAHRASSVIHRSPTSRDPDKSGSPHSYDRRDIHGVHPVSNGATTTVYDQNIAEIHREYKNIGEVHAMKIISYSLGIQYTLYTNPTVPRGTIEPREVRCAEIRTLRLNF